MTHGARLLVAEDEDAIAFAMRRYFAARGYEVDTAREMEEAEALLVNVRYDVAIIDLRLTGVHGAEGLDILTFVQTHCPDTRTVLLTAYASDEVHKAARERGAGVVLSKPQSLRDIAEVIGSLMSAR